MGYAYPCMRAGVMYNIICLCMSFENIGQSPDPQRGTLYGRGCASFKVAGKDEDVGLVEGYPIRHIAHCCNNLLNIGEEFLHGFVFVPGIFLDEPKWMREMMEGHHRFDAVSSENGNNFLIMFDGLFVPDMFTRLHPAPFEGKAVRIYSKIFQKSQIFPVQLIMVCYIRSFTKDSVP